MTRYWADPAFRTDRRRRSREAYADAKEPADQPSLPTLETSLTGEIPILHPADARCGTTVSTPLYKTGGIGRILGISPQSVRLWTKKRILPRALFASADGRDYRLYTYDQAAAIFQAIPLLGEIPDNGRENSAFAKQLRYDWARMPDGIQPQGFEPEVPADLLEDLPTKTYIYALTDPRTDEVRYVGQAEDPDGRHRNHVGLVERKLPWRAPRTPLGAWIRELLAQDLEPGLTILQTASKREGSLVEERWVQTYLREGADLLNDQLNGWRV